MRFTDSQAWQPLVRSAIWIFIAALSAGPLAAAHEPGYGFYRTVEGDVRLTTLDRAEPLDVEPNYPLLVGDRVWVASGARLEAVLPDQTILRMASGTDLYFQDLALYAEETAGEATVLSLLEGEIQVVVTDTRDERQPVRVDTPNATVYLQQAGVYRIYADERQWTEVVVREGFGEVALAEGSIVVRANEEAVIDGDVDPRVRVYPAGAYDALEAWGEELDREAQLAEAEGYVDESLRYQAAPLRSHGSWVAVDAGYAWRPYVGIGWRPYTRGYWTHTPGGYYWVSAEPWGFTFHYGSWGLHPYHGWIWYPGSVFSPAWVTWYWGPTYVGWVPSGYYSHYYRHRHGLRFGFYGWAGGSWGYYNYWTFCPSRYFGWRSYGSYWRSGGEIGRTARHDVPRGVILGTTREFPRGIAGRPEYVAELHARAAEIEQRANRKLPDVTDFVARRPTLSTEVREVVFADDSARSALRQGPSRSIGRVDAEQQIDARRPTATERWTADSGERLERQVRPMPSRPDLSREELVSRQPVRREMPSSGVRPIAGDSPGRFDRREPERRQPAGSAVRPVEPAAPDRFERREPVRRELPSSAVRPVEPAAPDRFERREPARETPGAIRTLPGRAVEAPPSARPEARPEPRVESRPLPRFETREPVRAPDRVESRDRTPESPRYILGRPASPSQRSLPPSAAESPTRVESRVPVVRRVLEGIRGSQSPSARPPQASSPPSGRVSSPSGRVSSPPPRASSPPARGSSPSRPSVSRPPSTSRTPPASMRRPSSSSPPKVSRPSSGSSLRSTGKSISSRGSSSSSSKSGRSSASARSQSRPKSKPPGD